MPHEPPGEFTDAATEAKPGLIRRIVTGQLPLRIPALFLLLSGLIMILLADGLLFRSHVGCVLYPPPPHYVINGSPGAWKVESELFGRKQTDDDEADAYAMISDLPVDVQPPLCLSPIYAYRRPHLLIGLTWTAADPLTDADIDALIRDVIDTHDNGVDATMALKPGRWTRSVSSSADGMTIDVDFDVMDCRILWDGTLLSVGAWINLFVFLWSCSSCFIMTARRCRRENRLAWYKANRICPFCRYDLRGAEHVRCPECGNAVPWNHEPND